MGESLLKQLKLAFLVIALIFISVGLVLKFNPERKLLTAEISEPYIKSVFLRYPYCLLTTMNPSNLYVYSIPEKKEILKQSLPHSTLFALGRNAIYTTSGWYYGAEIVTTNINLEIPYNPIAGSIKQTQSTDVLTYNRTTREFYATAIDVDFTYDGAAYKFKRNNIKWFANGMYEEVIFDCMVKDDFLYYIYLSKENKFNVGRVKLRTLKPRIDKKTHIKVKLQPFLRLKSEVNNVRSNRDRRKTI